MSFNYKGGVRLLDGHGRLLITRSFLIESLSFFDMLVGYGYRSGCTIIFSSQNPGTRPPSFLGGSAEDSEEKDGFQAS